ncbi:MAG: VIT family protein [Acidimicrobiales bacterium]|nr:VIT family protein [Acidimicrobiales bacterium]
MTRTLPDHDARERHKSGRAQWLRAGVLGANDGLISTSSLMIGVAAASADSSTVLLSGIAGLTAGALSMAAGEYVSVSSQLDTEQADIERERLELENSPQEEFEELVAIYERRGLSHELAHAVGVELSAADQLAVHARDELGIDVEALARPIQAAVVSALSFIVGALLPILVMAVAPSDVRLGATVILTLVGLVVLGSVGAYLGGAPKGRAAARVFVGGCLALLISVGIGRLSGAVV